MLENAVWETRVRFRLSNKEPKYFLGVSFHRVTPFQCPKIRLFWGKLKTKMRLLQGGIALTSPPCNKKQTSGLTEKGKHVLRNGRRKGGAVKIKNRTWRDTDYTQRNGRTRFLYYARVRGEKYRLLLRGGPTQKIAKKTVKNTT